MRENFKFLTVKIFGLTYEKPAPTAYIAVGATKNDYNLSILSEVVD
jgi:hypothetical protein